MKLMGHPSQAKIMSTRLTEDGRLVPDKSAIILKKGMVLAPVQLYWPYEVIINYPLTPNTYISDRYYNL